MPSAEREKELRGEIDRLLPHLIERGAEKIILFGSLSRGRVRRTSDIDLIVVQRTKGRFLDRIEEMSRGLAPRMALDLLIYTPQEIEDAGSAFLRRALTEGQVLYARAE